MKEQTLVLSNTGLADLEIKSTRFAGSAAEQFQLVNFELPLILEPAESKAVAARFMPSSPGNKSARVEISSNDPDDNPSIIKFRGEGRAAPAISVSNDTLDFGSVEVGDELDLSLTVKNLGFADLEIDKLRLTGLHDHQWLIKSGSAPLIIPPNESSDLVLSFKPTAVGEKTAALEISSNSSGENPKVVTLIGTAFKSGPSPFLGVVVINEIHYNPSSAQGSDADFEFIELANADSIPIPLAGFSFSAGVSHVFSAGDTLPANGFLVVAIDSTSYPGSVQWSSGNLVNTGELIKLVDADGATVDSVFYDEGAPWPPEPNGGGPTLELKHPLLDNTLPENWQASFALGGTPGAANSAPDTTVVSGPEIAVNPVALNFGNVPLGDSLTLELTISNLGDAELEISGVEIKIGSSASFVLETPSLPLAIPAGASEKLGVTYIPAQVAADSGTVEIASNDFDEPLVIVNLTGRGVTETLSQFAGVVVINEIHYNPSSAQGSDANFEFIELANADTIPIPLAGFSFSAGVSHVFSAGDTLPANGFLVVAIDSTSYPGSVQWSSGNLVNTGELIKLVDADGATVDSVFYDEGAPWPPEPNGGGPTLELKHPLLDNTLPENWQASFALGGTPGAANSAPDTTVVSGPEIAVNPVALNFGNVPLGDSLTLELTISNLGDAELEISGVEIKIGSSASFVLETPSLPLAIPAGASEKLGVTYIPAQVAADSGTVEIASNDFDEPLVIVNLTGRGVTETLSQFAGVVVINEIHYNPSSAQGSDANFEFLELHNASDEPINLAGFAFAAGITHTFQTGDTLPARGFLVLASNSANYPGSKDWDSGSLLNTGEALQLVDASGAIVDLVEYDDANPWPTAANGDGPSLELKDPLLDNTLPENWQASFVIGGTPGARNFATNPTAVSEPVSAPREFVLAQNYPNPFNPSTNIRFELPAASAVTLTIFDIRGEEIRKLISLEARAAGVHSVFWDGRDQAGSPAASGVYFYRIAIQPQREGEAAIMLTRKMLLLK